MAQVPREEFTFSELMEGVHEAESGNIRNYIKKLKDFDRFYPSNFNKVPNAFKEMSETTYYRDCIFRFATGTNTFRTQLNTFIFINFVCSHVLKIFYFTDEIDQGFS